MPSSLGQFGSSLAEDRRVEFAEKQFDAGGIMASSAQFVDEQIKRWQLRKIKLEWLTLMLLLAAVALGLAAAVAAAWTKITHGAAIAQNKLLPVFGNPPLAFFLHATQATIIFFFVRKHSEWLREIKVDLHSKSAEIPIQRETLRQFTRGWEWMWWGWFILYTWFAIASLIGQQFVQLGKPIWWVESVSDIFDVISGCAIWWCYLSLDLKSVSVGTNDRRSRPFWRGVLFVIAAGIACSILTVIDRKNQLGYFGVVLVGVFNSLGLASFTGRIGSNFIGTRRWVLTLFFYAILQVFYSLLPLLRLNADYWLPAVYISALLLKMVLAVAGSNMMRNGGLIRYLEAAESGLLDASKFDDAKWQAVRDGHRRAPLNSEGERARSSVRHSSR